MCTAIASVITNRTQVFTAPVTGNNNTAVTWTLACATGVTAGTCGTIDANASGSTLALDADYTITNSNMLEATAGGSLSIERALQMVQNGRITANDASRLIQELDAVNAYEKARAAPPPPPPSKGR